MKCSFKTGFVVTLAACLLLTLVSAYQQISQSLPKFSQNSVFFIHTNPEQNGQVGVKDFDLPQNNRTLTDTNVLVDQFLLWQHESQKKLFFLGGKEPDKDSYEKPIKSLYELDLNTGKQRKIVHDAETIIEKIWLHPQNRWIILEKRKRDDYERLITLYNLFNNQESPLPVSKPWVNFSFAPNQNQIVGLDTSKNIGYEIDTFWKPSKKETILGEYLENFGFSPNGKNILFSQLPNKDVFSLTNELVLINNKGDKNIIFETAKISHALWVSDQKILVASKDEDLYSTIEILDLETQNREAIADFGQNIIQQMQKFGDTVLITIEKRTSNQNSFEIHELDLGAKQLTKLTNGFFGQKF